MAQDFIPGTLAIHECFFPYRKILYFTGNNSSWIDIPRAASEFSGATLSLVHVNIPHCPCLARINRIPSSCLEKIKKKQPGKHIPIQQAHSFCSTAPGLPQPSFTVFKGSGFLGAESFPPSALPLHNQFAASHFENPLGRLWIYSYSPI